MFLDIEKQTKVTAPELTSLPDLPLEIAHLWHWFSSLNRRRQSGGVLSTLSWESIDGYFNRSGQAPKWWELTAIERLEDMYLKVLDPNAKQSVAGLGGMKKALPKDVT